MSSYRLTPQARTGLSSILEDVEARFGVEVAIEVLERIGSGLEILFVERGERDWAGLTMAGLTISN